MLKGPSHIKRTIPYKTSVLVKSPQEGGFSNAIEAPGSQQVANRKEQIGESASKLFILMSELNLNFSRFFLKSIK